MFTYLKNLLKTLLVQCLTGIDGVTFDPARVAGYGTGLVGVLAFATDCILHFIHSGALDAQSFSLEFAALSAGLAGIAAGVAIKSGAEPAAPTTTAP